MKYGADLKSKLSTPPAEAVTWEIPFPVRGFDGLTHRFKPSRSNRDARALLKVRARTWFEARTIAVRTWAQLGYLIDPQSVTVARIAA